MTDVKHNFMDKHESNIVEKIEEVEKQIHNIHDDSLLFRIYDKEQNILMYPEFSEIGVTFGESPDGVHYPKDTSDFLFDICAWNGTRYIAEKCTGLRDNAGRPIYENDEFVRELHRWRIIYVERNASFYALNLDTDEVLGLNDERINIDDIVIIGNIHEL